MTAHAFFSPIFLQKTDPPHLFTIRVVQHCAAVSAITELLLEFFYLFSNSVYFGYSSVFDCMLNTSL